MKGQPTTGWTAMTPEEFKRWLVTPVGEYVPPRPETEDDDA